MGSNNLELTMNQQIARCFPSRKNPTVCGMNMVQYNKLSTGGNNPHVSQRMRYSNYVQNFSKSRSVQPDVCQSMALHATDMNSNNKSVPHNCTNPIFDKNWKMKTGAQLCFCSATNSIIGAGVPITEP
jgi:hypothetical protein